MKVNRPADDQVVAALRRLARATAVPPGDVAREAVLLRAFDRRKQSEAATRAGGRRLAGMQWFSGLSAAVVLLVAAVVPLGTSVRRAIPSPGGRSAVQGTAASTGVRTLPVGDFIPWPGASSLPPLESGELVRMDLPVSILPSLGVAPPAGHVKAVKADVVIGQDGFARAVRFVGH